MEDKYAAQPEQEIAPKTPDADDVDALLQDVKSLLGESDGETAELPPPEDEPVPEDPGSEPLNAEDVHIDYGKFYGPEEPGQSKTPLTCYEQSKPAYQRARRAEYERIREQERLARAERQQAFEQERAAHMKQKKAAQKHANAHRSTAEYAEWLYTQGLSDDERSARAEQEEKLAQPESRRRKRPEKPKRRHGLRIALVLVLLLTISAAVFHFLIARAPQSEAALSARKKGCATILVAGTDEGGYRTDSMLLLNIDRTEKAIHLVSIPRDTLIYCEYSVPKINSAYGWAGGGEAGMQELLLRVSEIIGFEPDGYAVVDLSVFEQLVDLMGGSLEVESELGKGTVFTFTLMHKIADKKYYSQRIEKVKTSSMRESLSGKHVLLAEDNDLNAEIAVTILEEAGFVIERVEDGIQCVNRIEQMESGTYDLILMDIQMPNMDGYQAAQCIRHLNDKKKAEIPIIAMTANAFAEDRKRTFDVGMNGHIAKPIDIEKLGAVILSVLKKQESLQIGKNNSMNANRLRS